MMKQGYGGGLPWWTHQGFNQVSDGMKMKKSYALFNPLNDNPNQIGSRGLWGKMLSPVKRGYGNGFGFGDYDSGKRGFGGVLGIRLQQWRNVVWVWFGGTAIYIEYMIYTYANNYLLFC